MHWSLVKWQAVQELHRMDPQQTLASFVFPVIRYHARWNALTANDIRLWPAQRTDLKGYAVLSEDYHLQDFVPLKEAEQEPALMHGVMQQYLDRITALCKDEGIGLAYIDFNQEELLSQLQFDFAHDMADAGHANTFGAVKLTDYIGTVLLENGVQPVSDEQYETSRAYCSRQIRNANLYRISELSDVLAQLNDSDYLIFVTGSGPKEAALLGLAASGPFTAVIDQGNASVYGPEKEAYRFRENLHYSLEAQEKTGTIRVDDYTYERTGEGLQIVILDLEKGYVIDHSVFDGQGHRIQ
jgi:hypothetical protein